MTNAQLKARKRLDGARGVERVAIATRKNRVVEGRVARVGNIDAQCLFATYRLDRKAVHVETTFANVEELSYNRWLQG